MPITGRRRKPIITEFACVGLIRMEELSPLTDGFYQSDLSLFDGLLPPAAECMLIRLSVGLVNNQSMMIYVEIKTKQR